MVHAAPLHQWAIEDCRLWGSQPCDQAQIALVLLHGYGGWGRRCVESVPAGFRARAYMAVVAPDGPHSAKLGDGYAWYPLSQNDEKNRRGAFVAASAVLALLDALAMAFPAAAFVLAGFSQGAAVALAAGLNDRAGRICSVVAHSGALVFADGCAVPVNDKAIYHFVAGADDRFVPPQMVAQCHEDLSGAGMRCSLSVLQGRAHRPSAPGWRIVRQAITAAQARPFGASAPAFERVG